MIEQNTRAQLSAPSACREALDAEWPDIAEDDPHVVAVAHAIAEHGIGRSWNDFLPTNAYDIDHSDLIEYARAAVSAMRALSAAQSSGEGRCICQDQHRRGYCTEPGCPYALAASPAAPPVADVRAATIEWRPIETAPKDGSRILVTIAGRPQNTYVARWLKEEWQCAPLGDWVIYPTHWQLLPRALSDAKQPEGKSWHEALADRVEQLAQAGAKHLTPLQILGLIAFVRDGEGAAASPGDGE